MLQAEGSISTKKTKGTHGQPCLILLEILKSS
jgi:hypothetical protein